MILHAVGSLLAFISGERSVAPDEGGERLSSANQASRALKRLRGIIWRCLLIVAVYCVRFLPDVPLVVSRAAAILALSAACLGAGGAVGLLFGLPRSSNSDADVRPGEGVDVSSDGEPRGGRVRRQGGASRLYLDNTNLEEVSDWLTKILIGIGLTQIVLLPGALASISTGLAPAFGATPDAALVVGSTIVMFVAMGFIYCYLWARLSMIQALTEEHLANDLEAIEHRQVQTKQDERALRLVRQQLDAGYPEVALVDLQRPLVSTSIDARERAHAMAQGHRFREHEAWRKLLLDGQEKAAERHLRQMARSVRVFQALLVCDWSDPTIRTVEHQVHAQLGYALKDQAQPSDDDLNDAIEHLTAAMRLREEAGMSPLGLVTFNRAVVRIRRGDDTQRILDDLTAALRTDEILEDLDGDIRDWLQSEGETEVVKDWVARNEVLVRLIQGGGPTGGRILAFLRRFRREN